MFNNPVPLNSEHHRHLCYVRGRGYGLARALLSTPVVAGEASQIARAYVLVFSRDVERPPQAVLATEEGVNAHITGSDPARWLGRYVPAHLRRYPFVAVAAGTGEDGEQNLTLAVDWDAPNVSWHEGERLFTDGASPPRCCSSSRAV